MIEIILGSLFGFLKILGIALAIGVVGGVIQAIINIKNDK